MFTTIVVGFDGSDTAKRGLELACDIAGKYGAQVHLVHTPEPQTVAFAMGAMAGYHVATTMPHPDEVQAANEKVIEAGRAVAKSAGQTLSQTHIEKGDPGDVIVGYADKAGADLIVTGRRGLGALGALVQGSTSLRVNHLAKCPVMTVV